MISIRPGYNHRLKTFRKYSVLSFILLPITHHALFHTCPFRVDHPLCMIYSRLRLNMHVKLSSSHPACPAWVLTWALLLECMKPLPNARPTSTPPCGLITSTCDIILCCTRVPYFVLTGCIRTIAFWATTTTSASPPTNPPDSEMLPSSPFRIARPTFFQGNVASFFESGTASDLALPGGSPCPFCAESLRVNTCEWTVLAWTHDTAPDRIFFRSSEVFQGFTVVQCRLP